MQKRLLPSFVLVCALVALVVPSISLAASSGPNSPSAGTSDSSIGSISWSNPTNANTSDNADAEAVLTSSVSCASPTISEYLTATDFGFNIPAGSTIDGIKVEIEHAASDSNTIRDNRVRIIKGGTIGSTDKADTDTYWGTTDAYVSYGGSSDLWGETWTVSDVNSSSFGVALSASLCGSNPFHYARVDHVRITLTYTPDTTDPTISTLTPADNATDVAIGTNLTIEFTEEVDVETGNITIKNAANNSTVQTIDVTSGQVTGSGTNTITINPSSDLQKGNDYYIQIDATAFDDSSSNSFAGISDTTTWNFSTPPAPSTGNPPSTEEHFGTNANQSSISFDQANVNPITKRPEIATKTRETYTFSTKIPDYDQVQAVTLTAFSKTHTLTHDQNGTYTLPLPVPVNSGVYPYTLEANYGSFEIHSKGSFIVEDPQDIDTLIASINHLFRKVNERTPTYTEWLYWAKRIISQDKETFPELFGAMQWQKILNN